MWVGQARSFGGGRGLDSHTDGSQVPELSRSNLSSSQGKVRVPIHGYNDRCVAARELRLLPLDGAPDWDCLRGKRMASFEDRFQGVPEVVVPHGRRIVVVVVYRAVVAQSAALVEEEDLGSTLGPVGASDFLGLIV